MYGVSTLDSLTEQQLDIGLQKSIGTATTGKILTIGGACFFAGGYTLLLKSFDAEDWANGLTKGFTGGIMLAGGAIATGVGVPIWIVGSSRKRDIELTLVKFKGSASITGVGLTVNF
jgi:hypothetical protein